ncbi:hypothetical protein CH306_27700 [Rhodococcus sp. 15-725-2-2b]|jgi:hypothetical protein|uniref:hypothetical protein n=2 Tax=unclassified Rhodococcus (in: high G+C Gram-positive bacteria) TaxID=192944 RepID=UPI000B9B70F7|nr:MULTISPECIES: hypothetical protein [unclassified Rhodococcus (in: high G+C Gram-positive bacteria)]OZC60507.1 hypothetical protein CH277_27560 [Rhodococcus sp. 06-469-3-2]OZC73795.1 hypothetical protein CH274_24935 [Rhodococcus sp. 06-418-5]OZD40968.1 hypothetical protein CH264_25360 [Rhodococcus sp. 06-1477-1A]OZE01692.1 hypothetical protein CH250_26910 [Rhodococcus sp. 05-2255-3C]OZE07278.1 hypothetical protein CH249_19260 [Rhodococcus sp. 05-2255-3B1]
MATDEKTIAFYRLVKYDASGNKPMEHANWYDILTQLDGLDLEGRTTKVGDRMLIGEVYYHGERAHLKLAKVRDVAAWLGLLKSGATSLEDFETEEGNKLYEISVVSFLDFGNLIGLVQGSAASPTPSAVAEWFDELKIFTGVHLIAEAVLTDAAREQLQKSPEVSRIETKVSTTKAQALTNRGSRLGSVLTRVNDEFGPVTVTLIIQTSRAKENHEGRQIMRDEAGHLAAAASESEVSKAKAQLIHIDADEKTHSEKVDFLKQRITAKRKIAATDDEGNPIRIVSAVTAIMGVAAEHDSELRQAVGVEPANGNNNES